MIKNLFSDDDPGPDETRETKPDGGGTTSGNQVLGLFEDERRDDSDEKFVISEAQPESMAETVRRSGLAYSAGIAFVAAVVFMLILGWGFDLLIGSTPFGVIAGIVLGSIIGFIQLFRITSQIFKK